MKAFYLVLIFLLSFSIVRAQQDTSRVRPQDSSPIKGMSQKNFDAFRDGKPMEFDRIAELNHYPAPVNVLRYSKELKLDANQLSQVKDINNYLQRKVLEMGRFIIEEEKKLDDLFRTGKIDNGSLIYRTQQYGLFQGELRNAHLQAHLRTAAVLTKAQIKKYDELMGYN